jgi:4-alpha-glucanotransferase
VSEEGLLDLARAAGIAVDWVDAAGAPRRVTPEVLRNILNALGLPCGTQVRVEESRAQLATAKDIQPPLVTADAGKSIVLPMRHQGAARITSEDGTRQGAPLVRRRDGSCRLDAGLEPGYYQLEVADQSITLAVAPQTCFRLGDIVEEPRLWGLAVQLYGLRRQGDSGIGDTGAVRALVSAAARYGADAIALSPVHALFAADAKHFSPYSPSSRLFLNPLLVDPAAVFGADRVAAATLAATSGATNLETGDLIDWPATAANKFALLRALFESFSGNDGDPRAADFAQFRRMGGDLLERHALFEALHAARLKADPRQWNWRDWPSEWRNPVSPTVAQFAAEHAREITFHVFMQWLADRAFAAAQTHARQAGMRIGLISDLAVGMDSGGSHAWSQPDDLLVGLNVGAPPDIFNPAGQNWGLTAFSPRGLKAGGFAPFLATLRTAMRHAGGVRIDHAMSLMRLWVIPEGAPPADGAYLTYPFNDFLRLVKLESARHRAVVVAEDLGTVPPGFQNQLDRAGIAGMRVLWFERAAEKFTPPRRWSSHAVAMTSTHDLPTVAGWWRGADIETRERLQILGSNGGTQAQQDQRQADRTQLWKAFRSAGVADAPMPASNDTAPVVDAAVKFVGATPSPLAILPLEDALGLTEQPNLPGTIDEHPNWRRRYQPTADQIFNDPAVAARALSLGMRSRT